MALFDDYFLSFPAYFHSKVLPFQSLYPLFKPVFECKDVSFHLKLSWTLLPYYNPAMKWLEITYSVTLFNPLSHQSAILWDVLDTRHFLAELLWDFEMILGIYMNCYILMTGQAQIKIFIKYIIIIFNRIIALKLPKFLIFFGFQTFWYLSCFIIVMIN